MADGQQAPQAKPQKPGGPGALAAAAGASDSLETRALLGMVVHELRSPIQAILANAESMAMMPLSGEARSALERMQRSIDLVLRRLDSIGQYVRSSSTVEQPQARQFLLREHVRNVVAECADEAAANGQRIEVEFDEACPYQLQADAMILHQVLSNFVVNAVRHGDAGAILLRCSLSHMQPSGAAAVQISVTNPGSGVPGEEREAIWQPFFRSPPRTNRPRGMGLGLAVVKLLASLAGWEVGLSDETAGHTTFFVRVPC